MIDAILDLYSRNLDYAKRLVADIPDEKMAVQPAPGTNHAAWVIGHLARTSDFYATMFGLPAALPPEWEATLGGRSKPDADRSKYPAKEVLVKALEESHARLAQMVKDKGPAFWDEVTPDEKRRQRFPTRAYFLVHMCINHEAVHLGQLSAWRRVQGLPSV